MKLDINFSRIIRARESIGAPLGEVRKFEKPDSPMSGLELELIEKGHIELSEVELSEEMKFVGGVPSIGNQPVTLHIYQPHNDKEELETVPCIDGPKYHFFDCKTLERMREGGRFDRYIATIRSNGEFVVQPKDEETWKWGEEMDAHLLPCKFCLRALNYEGYKTMSRDDRENLVHNFPIDEMLESLKPIFRCMPLYSSSTMPTADYSSDWAQISLRTRSEAGWQCHHCKVVLDSKVGKGLLHVHHKDGIRGNNISSNLRVLCAECHKNQPQHGHMKLSAADLNLLARTRTAQGLTAGGVQAP